VPFIDIEQITPMEPFPGCRLRTPYGKNIMLSEVVLDAGAIVPTHQHPHEQAGIVLKGRLELTIDGETRVLDEGQMYIIPPNTPHRAAAFEGAATALDIFSPVREDYAKQTNDYIPASD
jgi:quercetin dioxygenase-like cupin family protein